MDLNKEAYQKYLLNETRRHFIQKCTTGLGAVALGSLLGCENFLDSRMDNKITQEKLLFPHFLPKAKRVIFCHMSGGPSQLELFDYKPELLKRDGQDCPKSLIEGKNFCFIKGSAKLLGASQVTFKQYGQSGAYLSNLLPHFSKIVDDVTFLKAMQTNEFNHPQGELFLNTGIGTVGRPSLGSWVTYGLGSENNNVPGYLVLMSGEGTLAAVNNPFGNGFLPSSYQGVKLRSKGDPILYITNPKGIKTEVQRQTFESINKINRQEYEEMGDPEIISRIAQYETAFRMQTSVPDLMDISKEPKAMHDLYGTEPGKVSFANNCLLARKLVENNVRFVQLFHLGWDQHGNMKKDLQTRTQEVDKAMSALITDLKQRGLLEDTLVIWGGEFGRTPMQQGAGTGDMVGRDHHPEAFTIWMAGGGIKPGISHGETDELGYYGIKNKVHVHDLHATILNRLGLDHEKLTYRYQGRDFRLTDVEGRVVKDIMA